LPGTEQAVAAHAKTDQLGEASAVTANHSSSFVLSDDV